MRVALLFLLCACLSISILPASTVGFTVTPLAGNTYHYDYFISGPILANQEFDIRFDPTAFASLANPTAGSGFFLIPCCQPNNPPGAFGDYAILALTNVAAPSGSFGVDVAMIGSASPGPQPFFINQLDANGNVLFNISSGFTQPGMSSPGSGEAPEPSAGSLLALGLIAGAGWWMVRRRRTPVCAEPGRVSSSVV